MKRPSPALVTGVVLGAFALAVALTEPFERLDEPLPPLPLVKLDGSPVPPGHFDGRPWIVNVWLPG